MPELPEVETIRRDLARRILNKKISRTKVYLNRAVPGNRKIFLTSLAGNYFTDIKRIGKLMIFSLGRGGKYLLVHLKMTGQLIYCSGDLLIAGGHSVPAGREKLTKLDDNLPNRHTRVALYFQDRSALFFNDMRTFGYWRIVDRDALEAVMSKFGLDPLGAAMNAANLARLFKGRQVNVKSLLLNQGLIAGIGNIYADEILFAAGVRPDRAGRTITPSEAGKIAIAARRILRQAIKYRGTTFNDYTDSEGRSGNFLKLLKVYGRKGKPCRCGGVVQKIKVAGRGTHYCPQCQK